MKSPLCRAGVDDLFFFFFWTSEKKTAWRTLVGDPAEARDFTHDIRVFEGSLFAVAHWNDGFTNEIPALPASVHKGHEAAASGTVKRPLPLWESSCGTFEVRQVRVTI